METRVSYYSDGCKLAGTLFVPDGLKPGEKRSGIVFAHGFTGTRDTLLLPFSRFFCEKGYVCLSFDYRGFGQSEGARFRLLPMNEVEDLRASITFLQQQANVDEDSIGVFGTSFGGAVSVYGTALDERVKCLVVNISVGNGAKWLRSLRSGREWRTLLDELKEDRVRRVMTGKSKMVSWLYVMPDEASRKAREEIMKTDPTCCQEVPLETPQAVIEFKPDEVVHKIAPRPVLFTVAERDILTPVELTREMFDRAGEPKKWVVVPGAEHYETYSPPHSKLVIDEAFKWFTQYLPVQKAEPGLWRKM
ncbi:MAG: alpha/beta hydrolase [Chloroflexota bacterium]|nr:alpha/beta hydrolase [Chloroflexota bacterium]